MRNVGKFKDKDIRLNSFHMGETYGGFLAGPSDKWMEEHNVNILKRLEGEYCTSIFGSNRPTFIIGKDSFDLKKRLPNAYVMVWLSCPSTVQDPDQHGSHLVLMWFQDPAEDPFLKLAPMVSLSKWEKHARDFQY